MSSPGGCETGCAEHKLLLVRAEVVDTLATAEREILASVATLCTALDELTETTPQAAGSEAAYDALRDRARAALAQPADERLLAYVRESPAEAALTWWCDRCDGIDAPQPCLGICVWRTVQWTRHDSYLELRQRVLGGCELEQRLRNLLRRIVHTSPRSGQHLRSWTAYAQEARSLQPGGVRKLRS